MKASILDASVQTVVELGLGAWTVDAVARRAGCAKGLVPYHFGSKTALLAETARALREAHAARGVRAVAAHRGSAMGALDALWDALSTEVRSGWFAAWLAVTADPGLGRPGASPQSTEAEPHLAAERSPESLTPTLARALGIGVRDLPAAEAVNALVSGCQVRLLAGAAEAEVREAYDRLWLQLLS